MLFHQSGDVKRIVENLAAAAQHPACNTIFQDSHKLFRRENSQINILVGVIDGSDFFVPSQCELNKGDASLPQAIGIFT